MNFGIQELIDSKDTSISFQWFLGAKVTYVPKYTKCLHYPKGHVVPINIRSSVDLVEVVFSNC